MPFIAELFRTKSVARLKETADEKGLKKTLGALDITLMGIGAIIGAGIFVITGVAAARDAGPGIVLSFIISGVACVLIALVYAELASMIPVAGSTYTYTYAALGEIIAWIVGWDLILEYTFSISMVASGWSGYMVNILGSGGINLPYALTTTPSNSTLAYISSTLAAAPSSGTLAYISHALAAAPSGVIVINLPAMIIPLFIGLLLIRGTRESATFNRIIVGIKLLAIFIFIVLAVPKFNAANWTPFLPHGFNGALAGAAIVFTAYLGFDSISTTAEETKNPARDLPLGIIGSLLICTALYIVVSALLTGLVPYWQLDNPAPVAYALSAVGDRLGAAAISVGAIAGITTVLLVTMYGQTRIVFAMSRDGFLPGFVSRLHPKYGTPYMVTLVTASVGALVAGLVPIDVLTQLVNIGTLFAFILSAIGVLVLRYKMPDLPRPFKCPAIYVVTPLAVIICAVLMYYLPLATGVRFILWFCFGLIIYFGYGFTHSTLSREKAVDRIKPK